MMPRALATIAAATAGTATGGDPVIDRVVTDSREAQPGALFVALVGDHRDGHDFEIGRAHV